VFLASPADIAIFGGARGPGKTYALLLDPIRHLDIPEFRAVMFRRTYNELLQAGGLWQTSYNLYPRLGGVARQDTFEWRFPSGAQIKCSHMQHETDRYSWLSAQITLLEFDQLEGFTANQFWFMLTCLRSLTPQVVPYVRAGANPVPADDPVGGWLHHLVQWWIDPVTGWPIPERSGVIRWFVQTVDDVVEWGDEPAALRARHAKAPMSLTFIPGRLEDNVILESRDPQYRGIIMNMPFVERERALGNWNVRPTAGKVFNRAWFPVVDAAPAEARRVRYWDKASVEGAGDYSAGVRMARAGGVYYVEDVVRDRWSALNRNRVMRQVAEADGPEVEVWVEQEGGSGGRESAEITVVELAGYSVRADRVSGAGSKLVRAGPLSAQAEAGNVRLVRAEWNEEYLRELHGFPDGRHDDQVDASSGAFAKLALDGPTEVGVLGQPAGPRRVILRL